MSLPPQIFERILFVWAIRHPASGYVQGINDLVTPFFVVFVSEHTGKSRRGILPQTCAWPAAALRGEAWAGPRGLV